MRRVMVAVCVMSREGGEVRREYAHCATDRYTWERGGPRDWPVSCTLAVCSAGTSPVLLRAFSPLASSPPFHSLNIVSIRRRQKS